MSLENTPRVVEVQMSRGNVNDAFTSLLLSTGHLHDGERITNVHLSDVPESNLRSVQVVIDRDIQETKGEARTEQSKD